ncbi:DNA-3-methyladenine glycosylase family protein [Microlunatus soli]|uniref:DNA-3-methyladenine glycosylase family protein n=1 Tax=Microlunatus soli TaxID=630515 RepID=UPI001E3FBD7E|nr:DNA-3-methyladenine glycosylase 2 family protein [Microlunatus soli]
MPYRPMVGSVFGGLQRGSHDPTHQRCGSGWLRASRTPEGPVLLRVSPTADGVHGRAWGAGAEWALDQLPALFGADDDPTSFRPRHSVLQEAVRRLPDLRLGSTGLVFEALAPSIIEQKVTGLEAYGAFRRLVTRYGEPAPGPARQQGSAAYGMRLPPDPRTWATIPSWRFLQLGLESTRSRALVGAARRGSALERLAGRSAADADRGLRSLPGIGAWTSAEVRQRTHGDADAWSIGDYHVGKDITWALTGEVLDDDACTEILEPYRGHRYRVQVLLGMMGLHRPRRAPRMTLPTHTPYAMGLSSDR